MLIILTKYTLFAAAFLWTLAWLSSSFMHFLFTNCSLGRSRWNQIRLPTHVFIFLSLFTSGLCSDSGGGGGGGGDEPVCQLLTVTVAGWFNYSLTQRDRKTNKPAYALMRWIAGSLLKSGTFSREQPNYTGRCYQHKMALVSIFMINRAQGLSVTQNKSGSETQQHRNVIYCMTVFLLGPTAAKTRIKHLYSEDKCTSHNTTPTRSSAAFSVIKWITARGFYCWLQGPERLCGAQAHVCFKGTGFYSIWKLLKDTVNLMYEGLNGQINKAAAKGEDLNAFVVLDFSFFRVWRSW